MDSSLMSMDSQQNLYFANSYPIKQINSFNRTNGLIKPSRIWNSKIILFKNIIDSLSTILTSNQGKVDGYGNQASFSNLQGIYFDSSSKNLIIADNGNYAVRKMNQSGFHFYFLNFIISNK